MSQNAARIESRVLNEAEIASAARTLGAALHDDPFVGYVFPDPVERARRLPEQFAALVRFSSLFGAVVVAEDMLGVSTWQPPGVHVTPERADRSGYGQLRQIMGDDAFERFGRTLDYLSAVHSKGLPEAYWYLTMIGVAPERCGCGIGRALVEPIMRQADAAGLPICLETAQPMAATFFGKLGFRPIIETVDPGSGVRFWTCQRESSRPIVIPHF